MRPLPDGYWLAEPPPFCLVDVDGRPCVYPQGHDGDHHPLPTEEEIPTMADCGKRTYGELVWSRSTKDGWKKARPCVLPPGHDGDCEGRATPDELEARHAGGVRKVTQVPVGWYVLGMDLSEPQKYVRLGSYDQLLDSTVRLTDDNHNHRDYAPTDRVLVMSPEEADQARYVRDESAERAAENRHL